MRNRSNSGVRLDYFQRLVNKTILKHQNPVTGLFPASDNNSHAWVRDNVYSILSVWGLALSYRKTADLDEDLAKAYELEQSVVKLMRGLLCSMMLQTDKLEKFKHSQSPVDCFHAKYSSKTGKAVVGDSEWGHLQLDATSVFVLFLAQMTASGLQIVYTLDEVAFIQNMVFYIETAYRTPDYGIWERGDKTNHGLPELNSSSIGMAKAALEAINELDLFGARGGPASIIHSLPDEAQQCQAILHSMLPRESSSKEIDAALISVISFPAFAVDDIDIINKTRDEIEIKLMGKFGCKRFQRDGYKTAVEDPNRLHYEPWELLAFEKIECHWPVFFAYFILDGLYSGNNEQVDKYKKMLDEVILKSDDGTPLMPEMYCVPREKVDLEVKKPNSQKRVPIGKLPQMWSQSLYILSRLIDEKFISPGELDPLNRRLITEPKPDVVVQVVILAEDSLIQSRLADEGIFVQTIPDVSPIKVYPARVLSEIYSLLGKNKKLGLTGRPSSEIGLLATSKLYILEGQIMAFIPQFVDQHQFYLPLDVDFLVDTMKNNMDDLARNWRMMGRPTCICPINGSMLEYCFVAHQVQSTRFLDQKQFYTANDPQFVVSMLRTEVSYIKYSWKGLGRPILAIYVSSGLLDRFQQPPSSLVGTIKKLQSGYIAGTRVHLGNLQDFVSTSCVTKLSFVQNISEQDQGDQKILDMLGDMIKESYNRPRLLSFGKKASRSYRHSSVRGIVRRSRSIAITDTTDISAIHAQLQQRGVMPVSPESSVASLTIPGLPGFPGFPGAEDHTHHHLKGGQYPSPNHTPTGSPTESPKLPHKMWNISDKHFTSDNVYANINVHELVDQLSSSESLNEQADIVHYLYVKKGLDWDTEVDGKDCTVRELLVELYEKAGHWKQWWLVRHSAGMLQKRVEDLALAATDLLVRQKQLSVGLPPDRENIITRPLPPDELATIIYSACGEDLSQAALTQELLIYLAMFIRTEPKLFHEMLRLRVGLIIQVMATELARIFKCSGDEASEHLLNLSPYELKTMLHHILSGKEFTITTASSDREMGQNILRVERRRSTVHGKLPGLSTPSTPFSTPSTSLRGGELQDTENEERQGQWLRRRRLDGSLNRVPVGFYTQVWKVLEKCHGLSIGGHSLPQSLTREMTSGEFKFALQVERVLNMIPQPEYRQLMVEGLMVTTLLVDSECRMNLSGKVIEIDKIVHKANQIFITEQKITPNVVENSQGAAGIVLHFYDTAPSGRLGTMSYLCRALACILDLGDQKNLECTIS